MKIELLEETSSTNDEVKRYLSAREDVIVCARRQTAGRGTKGRTFLSEEGGVYLSALTFPKGLRTEDAFLIMAHAAVAVCRTAEAFGVRAHIKWPNDVLVGTRKLCGILIENALSDGFVDHSIAGIGLNVFNDVSPLGGIAVTLSEAAGRPLGCEEVRDVLIASYRKESTFAEYLSYAAFLGKRIRVTEGEKTYFARAACILPDGRLQIETEEGLRALSAAEISIQKSCN